MNDPPQRTAAFEVATLADVAKMSRQVRCAAPGPPEELKRSFSARAFLQCRMASFGKKEGKEGKEHTERSQRKIICIFQSGKYNETHTVCSFCPTPFFSWREVRLPIQSAQRRCERGFRCLFGRGDYSTHNHAGSCPVEVAASVVSRAFPHPESFRTPPLAAEFSKVLECPTSGCREPR